MEKMLEHSDLFHPSAIFEQISTRFKALRWTISGRRDRTYLCREIKGIKYGVRIHSHKFTPDGELHLETSHGNINFFNP